jgi:hypothetical protein
MTGTILLVVALLTLAVALFVFRAIPGVRAYFKYRGKRLVTCPETHKPAAVDVAAGEAAIGAFLSAPTLRLRQCSRWPERHDCGEECLQQIEAAPENCLVWNIVADWYRDKECVICHKAIGELHHLDQPLGLVGPDHKTMEWKEVRPEQLRRVFATHRPLCSNCYVTETFRSMYPELVTDREPELKHLR